MLQTRSVNSRVWATLGIYIDARAEGTGNRPWNAETELSNWNGQPMDNLGEPLAYLKQK